MNYQANLASSKSWPLLNMDTLFNTLSCFWPFFLQNTTWITRTITWRPTKNVFHRPISFSQVEALLPSRLSRCSQVSGSLSLIRCPDLSGSHVPFIPLRLNCFMSEGYLRWKDIVKYSNKLLKQCENQQTTKRIN